ncbi:probable membrane-associated kinase regulator 6 isoform X2 [Lactuca sativa]|uniref:probable membrane-associated kinase regulator 6 isoform X2 n=1 Tax=Lactuca sativa TaxID=4236 RepID=UPI000CD8060B|nr:probable membrane-associated kinase regulator 6 isoform X2 [Lactuca sativa]
MSTHHKEFDKHILNHYSSFIISSYPSMEASESLSIESFSYSWLVNLKPSFETSFRASFDDDSNFIEMDPKLSASKRFLVFHQDFDFDLPTLQPNCVHADELISNGILVPLFLKPLDIGMGIYDSVSSSTPVSPVSSATHGRSRSLLSRRYRRLPKSVVRKYLNLAQVKQTIGEDHAIPRVQFTKRFFTARKLLAINEEKEEAKMVAHVENYRLRFYGWF